MRNQTTKLKTGKWQRLLVVIAVIVLLALTTGGFYRAFIYEPHFIVPEFDTNVKVGIPSPEESLRFGSVSSPTGFAVGLCGTMYQQQDGSLLIYLTNPKTNDVNIRCEIKNDKGKIIYQTGVIKPDEYIEKLSPLIDLKNEATNIKILIYAYEQDTWYSKGTITLENILQAY